MKSFIRYWLINRQAFNTVARSSAQQQMSKQQLIHTQLTWSNLRDIKYSAFRSIPIYSKQIFQSFQPVSEKHAHFLALNTWLDFENKDSRVWRGSGEWRVWGWVWGSGVGACCFKSSVTVSNDLGSSVICRRWSTVFSKVYSRCNHLARNSRAHSASLCWQSVCGWFLFSAALGISPHCQKNTKNWFDDYCKYSAWLGRKHTWPETHNVHPPKENLWAVFKRKVR